MGGQWAPWPNHMALIPSSRTVLMRSLLGGAVVLPATTAVLIPIKSPRIH